MLGWHDSVEYWTSVIFQASRAGSPGYAANQSIQGVLARAGLDPHSPAGAVTWLVLAAVVVAVACRGMSRAFAASADAWALSLNAFACLLISPISWSHHWVWGETAVLTLAILSWRGQPATPARAGRSTKPGQDGTPGRGRPDAGAPLPGDRRRRGCHVRVSPQWWFPSGGNRELHWAAWEHVVGSSYVIFAAAVLLAAACWPRRRSAKLQRADAERQPRALVGTGGDHQR